MSLIRQKKASKGFRHWAYEGFEKKLSKALKNGPNKATKQINSKTFKIEPAKAITNEPRKVFSQKLSQQLPAAQGYGGPGWNIDRTMGPMFWTASISSRRLGIQNSQLLPAYLQTLYWTPSHHLQVLPLMQGLNQERGILHFLISKNNVNVDKQY